MTKPHVCVIFGETPEGQSCLAFAARFHRQLAGDRLHVYLASDESRAALSASSAECAEKVQQARVTENVRAHGLSANEIEIHLFHTDESDLDFPPDAIVVNHRLAARRGDINVLVPFDEVDLDQRGKGPFLIAFGDGDSGKYSTHLALELAAVLARKVVFYHTTWKAPEVNSEDPYDHMSRAARQELAYLEAWAEKTGVEFASLIRCDPDVTQGLLNAAIDVGASLLVMARGRKTKIGSYLGRALTQSPIPILSARTLDVSELPRATWQAKPRSAKTAPDTANAKPQTRYAWLKDKVASLAPAWLRKRLGDPIFVMFIVALMYVGKAILKGFIGWKINSPMIFGDGMHNLGDLFEAAAVIAVILVVRRPPTERFAYGRKNMEWFTALVVGLLLLGTAVFFAVKSVVGLLAQFPGADEAVRSLLWLPEHEHLIIDNATFPWLLLITSGSVILSLVIGRYQVAVGEATKHDSLVADGKETLSDGRIEVVTLVGVIAEHVFHSSLPEYPLGLLVAYFITRTGWELFHKGFHVLLQHTIGLEHEAEIRSICDNTRGVAQTVEVKTFQIGRIAVCNLTVRTRREGQAVLHIKAGIERSVERYVLANDFTNLDPHIDLKPLQPDHHRQAIALVRRDGIVSIAPSIEEATSIMVCDVESGKIFRATEEPPTTDLVSLLIIKKVRVLIQFGAHSGLARELADAKIELTVAASYLPELVGLPREVLEGSFVS